MALSPLTNGFSSTNTLQNRDRANDTIRIPLHEYESLVSLLVQGFRDTVDEDSNKKQVNMLL